MKPEITIKAGDVARVFNALADEHAKKLEATEGQRTLLRIQALSGNRRRAQLSFRRLALWTLAPAFGAALVTLGITSWLGPDPLSFDVDGTPHREGLIQAHDKPAIVSFSDDSRVVAEAHSSLNVSLVGEHGALARVREGKLRVKVEHADTTDWRFLAGPYEVRVVGTEFDLTWRSELSQLSIVMHEGRVRVMGPEKSETILNAGDSHTFGLAPERVAAVSPNTPARPASPRLESAEDPTLSPAPNAARAVAQKPVSWAKLVSKGRFLEVVEEAEGMGLDSALGTRSSQDLEALAQAAHYTGHGALALKTWSKVRERFGTQRIGRQAAFFMGRIYDQQGNAQSALSWLNVYLGQAGSDTYTSEALGRKLTLVQRLQGKAAAERVAREYLTRFPKGADARTARALLEQ